jgi:hypothetical protein
VARRPRRPAPRAFGQAGAAFRDSGDPSAGAARSAAERLIAIPDGGAQPLGSRAAID